MNTEPDSTTRGRTVRDTVLDNGLRVLTERIDGARSVATGFWIRQGAAHETAGVMGVSHLLEHMVFKGTETRTQRDIALSLESLGGHLDAYTSREHTSFQARVLDAHLPIAIDVLTDLTFRPLLAEEALKTEREVVLEEIATVEDTPDDLIFDLHNERLWGDHGYGHRILGTDETVGRMTVDDLRAVHADRYAAANAVLVAVGRVDHDELVALAERHAGAIPTGTRHSGIDTSPVAAPGTVSIERDSAQTHIVTGRTTVPHGHADRYPIVLISQALGGGMSSRLFQRVREDEGLAYAVYSWQSFYQGGGIEGVYVGTRPESADRAAEVVDEELRRVAREGLTADELAQVKEQVKGHAVLSLDSMGTRLHRIAGYALRGEEVLGVDRVLEMIDAVTAEDVARVASELFDPAAWLSLRLGPSAKG